MGGEHMLVPPEEEIEDSEANVFCNVYDILPGVNSVARCLHSDWGIYHTGVQVHGLEFAYGGHPDASTGVFCAKPRSAQGATFREQVPIGRIDLDPLELRQAVAEVSRQWSGDSYDPFKRNCNHFSDFLCRELTGKPAPAFINRFSTSQAVRGIFYRCVVPIGRCIERFYEHGGITYADDDTAAAAAASSCGSGGGGGAAGGSGEELGISGARGINQVLVEAATAQKVKANRLFKDGGHAEAREAYSKALGYLRTMSRRTEEEDEVCEQAQAVRVALLLNLAACDLKTGDYARVIETCNTVLDDQPDHQKALYRRGVACSHLGRLDAASADLRKVLKTAESEGDAATARDARRELARVKKLVEAQRQEDRAFARRMIGGAGASE